MLHQVSFYRGRVRGNSLAMVLAGAISMTVAGLFLVLVLPFYRVGMLHLTLIGGFGLIALVVAIRVVFGHSGQRARSKQPNHWMTVAAATMVVAMLTRVSGDL